MHVTQLEWIITLGVTIAVLLFDVIVIGRRPHEPSKRETATYLTVYVGLAVAFGLWVWFFHGSQFGLEFFAGWLTEYSLSVDNLFIFLIIMASFNVPKKYQQQALLVGIILALIFRGIFIALGAVAINQFSWVFYVFGAFLVYTAINLVRDTDHDDDAENIVVRFARRHLKLTDKWDGLQAVDQGERQAADDADVPGHRRAGHHRPAVRAGLDSRDLRPDPGALPGVHRQRVRADGSAPAVLPAGRSAQAAGLPVAGAGVHPGLHRREADPARAARERAAVHQRR